MYTLTLEITKRCNLKCRYCYVQKNEDMMQLDVGYKSIDISLRQAKKTNVQTHNGRHTFPNIVNMQKRRLKSVELKLNLALQAMVYYLMKIYWIILSQINSH